ncbi:MAG: hypothetical protein CMF50_00585 [Legionellales bacterium]|nr:hypothetical protein [Legionellales bacterium]
MKYVESFTNFNYYSGMKFIHRLLESRIDNILSRDKSILLLGPRQTGKSTLLVEQITTNLEYSFLEADVRRRYETNPELLLGELKAYRTLNDNTAKPLVYIDEIQKIPAIMDTIQYAIDQKLANFVLTGSSARKLKHNRENIELNLLPGRVIELRMDALSVLEMSPQMLDINDLLLNGSLPEIIQQKNASDKEELLNSYVNIYLEEEVRAEALVRNLASFSRFLTYAAIGAGKETNINKLSEELGLSRHTLNEYYRILMDCLVVNRVEPLTKSPSRRRLTKAVKYLFFDLGVRRIAAGEGLRLPQKYYGDLFEQFVGNEIVKLIHLFLPQAKLKYWHDHAGPEVDYVIEFNRQYIPIEVKWTETPSRSDARHVFKFMDEYDCMTPGYIVCRTPKPVQLADNVIAVGWGSFISILKDKLASE